MRTVSGVGDTAYLLHQPFRMFVFERSGVFAQLWDGATCSTMESYMT